MSHNIGFQSGLGSLAAEAEVKRLPVNLTMKKEIAIKIMVSLESLGEALNDLAANIEIIKDIEEKKKFRKGLDKLIGRSFTDIMHPIIREYPELDPDKDSNWYKDLQKKRKLRKNTRDKIKDIEEKALKKIRGNLSDDIA